MCVHIKDARLDVGFCAEAMLVLNFKSIQRLSVQTYKLYRLYKHTNKNKMVLITYLNSLVKLSKSLYSNNTNYILKSINLI